MADQAQAPLNPMEPQTPTEVAGVPPARRRSILGPLLYWARDLLLSIVLAIVVILFLYQPVKVEGTSMEPTLTTDHHILLHTPIYPFPLREIPHRSMASL